MIACDTEKHYSRHRRVRHIILHLLKDVLVKKLITKPEQRSVIKTQQQQFNLIGGVLFHTFTFYNFPVQYIKEEATCLLEGRAFLLFTFPLQKYLNLSPSFVPTSVQPLCVISLRIFLHLLYASV